jgi:hypothetical protein
VKGTHGASNLKQPAGLNARRSAANQRGLLMKAPQQACSGSEKSGKYGAFAACSI